MNNTKKKNVAIDAHMLGDNSGGNERYYANILYNMEFPSYIQPILLLKEGIDDSKYVGKFQIVRFKIKNAFLRNFIELPLICYKYNVKILHTQYFIPLIRICKTICTIHDICFEHFEDIFSFKNRIIQKILIKYAAKKADYIVTVSNFSINDISNTYNISKKKFILATNAVDDSFKCNKNYINDKYVFKKFNIKCEKFLLCVGNLQPRKNLVRLFKAFEKYILKSNYNHNLVVVGKKAWLYDDIFSSITDSIKNKIIFTDYVSNDDLIKIYNSAHAFIFPSIFEGFGIPPLEALACSVPVAVSNNSSLPEVIGNSGIYFNPFCIDEIIRSIDLVMNNDNIRNESIKNGAEQVRKFSWRDSARNIVNCYIECLNCNY